MSITVNSLPSIVINGDLTLCPSESSTLTATGGTIYNWSTNQTGPSITVSPLVTTTYTVTVTNSFSCTLTASAVVTVSTGPVISAIDSTIETCSAGNGSLQLTVTSGIAPYTYAWSNNAGNVSQISNINAGTYIVTVTDNGGCSITKTIILRNSATPTLTVESKIDDHCTQGVGEINIVPTGGTGNYSYTWNTNPVQNIPHLTHLSAGSYTVVVNDGNCTDSITLHLGDTPSPVANFDFTPKIINTSNADIRFINHSTGGALYYWSFGDGSTSDIENPSHFYSNAQNYLAYLIVSDGFGCSDTAFNSVVITDDYYVYIPSAFTPSGDDLNDVFKPKGKGYSNWDYRMIIFDRWGKQVFYSSEFEFGWDGKIDGKVIDVNTVYVYKIQIIDLMGLKHYYTGRVTALGTKLLGQ
jgi:gliding motility-associated-like protein